MIIREKECKKDAKCKKPDQKIAPKFVQKKD